MSIQIGNSLDETTGSKFAHEAGQEIHLKAGMKVIIEAMQVSIKGAGGFVDVGPSGVTIQGTMVLINSGGAAGTGSGVSAQDPETPDEADDGTKTGKMN
jgi:type VI secretion system secreted protein VgrG